MKTGKCIQKRFVNEPNLTEMKEQNLDNIGRLSVRLTDDLNITFYRNIIEQIKRKD